MNDTRVSRFPYTVPHIVAGSCRVRMTVGEMDACHRKCAEAGDPPCWRLPALTSDWPLGKPVRPCTDCMGSLLPPRTPDGRWRGVALVRGRPGLEAPTWDGVAIQVPPAMLARMEDAISKGDVPEPEDCAAMDRAAVAAKLGTGS